MDGSGYHRLAACQILVHLDRARVIGHIPYLERDDAYVKPVGVMGELFEGFFSYVKDVLPVRQPVLCDIEKGPYEHKVPPGEPFGYMIDQVPVDPRRQRTVKSCNRAGPVWKITGTGAHPLEGFIICAVGQIMYRMVRVAVSPI